MQTVSFLSLWVEMFKLYMVVKMISETTAWIYSPRFMFSLFIEGKLQFLSFKLHSQSLISLKHGENEFLWPVKTEMHVALFKFCNIIKREPYKTHRKTNT